MARRPNSNNLLGNLTENSDAAKRISDTVKLHLVAATDIMDAVGKWCVFALRDGTSDGVMYDTKEDAVRIKKSHAKDFCYLQIAPDGISQKDAWHFLKVNRHPRINTTDPAHRINPMIYEPSATVLNTENRE